MTSDACLLCHRLPKRYAALCWLCRGRVGAALAGAPKLYVRGTQAVSGVSQGLSDKISTPKPGPRSPLRDGLLELCDDLARALAGWAAATAARAGLPVMPGLVRAGYGVQRSAALLAENLNAALEPPYGVAHAARVLALTAALEERLGLALLVHQLAAPCPHCDARALIRRDGDDHVSCRLCGQAWPERHYALLARIVVAERTTSK